MEWVRKATGSAAALVDPSGRVLLLRRAYPPYDWVMPGGNAEAGESPVETLRREVREETGLLVEPELLTGVYYQADHRAGESSTSSFAPASALRRASRRSPPKSPSMASSRRTPCPSR